MTTIVIAQGQIAYDARISDGDMIYPDVIDKVWLSRKHHCVYCGYGEVSGWWSAAQYLEGLQKLPWDQRKWKPSGIEDMDNAGLTVVMWDGKIYHFEGKKWYPAKDAARHALGTGAKAALGALLAGASPRKAVEIAIKLDPNSGPPVKVIKIADIPHPR